MDLAGDVRRAGRRRERLDRAHGLRGRLQKLIVSGWWAVAFVVQWVLLAVLAVVVVALARQIGVLHLRLDPLGALEIDDEGPGLGEAPPARSATAASGSTLFVGGAGRQRLLAFVSPTCPVCERVVPSLPAAADAFGLELQVVSDAELERAYKVPGVPFVVVFDEFGVVRSKGTVNTLEQVEGLVDTARRRILENRELRAS